MANKYYILTLTQLDSHLGSLEYDPIWNVAETECIIEVSPSYNVPEVLHGFGNSNAVQDYINDPIRIDEWYQPDISEIP
jgi:hypothetical protein